ncbi:MAG TPA: LysM peptidoglycan-binding domain-containing protein, partial [Candidatus Binatia bacterium]|nr:LysM peptidoglycan-binding domain-containing protein [Candidatus Binatia bacterium]
LRLSVDAVRLAEERMEEIRSQAKITFLQHNVRKGESLQGLANRYKTTVPVLKELNGLKRDSLGRTARLVIPVTGLMETEAVPGTELSPDQLTMAHMRMVEGNRRARIRGGRSLDPGDAVTVRKGDTLARLAKRHGVRVKILAKANGLKTSSKLKPGTRLVLPEPSVGAARDVRKRTTRYKVHKGDTLSQIARVYGVTVDRIADRTRLKKAQLLNEGLVLVIPLES